MAPLDSAADLADLPGESPAGENLEFDPGFAELERLAQGKPEQQYGTTIVPAEEPDWKLVVSSARELTERSYDLRVLTLLAVGRLQREGLDGYADTLTTIRRLLDTRWAAVHPQLDPEDDNDPMLRANALLRLGEPGRVMRVLRSMPLARSVRGGTVSWRDVAASTGAIEVEDGAAKPTEAAVAGVFRDADAGAMAALRGVIGSCLDSIAAIPAAFDDNAGYGTGPDFTDLVKLLREMARTLDAHARTDGEDAPAPEPDGAGTDTAAAAVGAAPGTASPRSAPVMSIATMGPPTNRADAMRLLELVIEFYERNEPSSPLPLLIARARRLAEMGFLDILRDMAPEGVGQAERIAGVPAADSY